MPQNWWEMFPEIQPSPAARPRPLPMPNGIGPGAMLSPQAGAPSGGFGLDQAANGTLAPTYSFGGNSRIDEFQGRYPGQLASPSALQAPFGGQERRPTLDRNTLVQQAIAAIQRGADPKVIRARLSRVGLDGTDLAPEDPFSDLVPGHEQGPMTSGTIARIGTNPPQSGSDPGHSPREPVPGPSASTFREPMPIAVIGKPMVRKAISAGANFQPDDPPEDPFTDMMAADERGVALTSHPGPRGGRHDPYSEANLTLGPNEQYRANILAAARYYHLAPQGVAATVGTEMLPGRWNPHADNGVAVGLSQFKADTWVGEAQRRGSYLNRVAGQLGYLDSHGRMIPARRQQFLVLRNDPEASIWAAADYAAYNLNVLRGEGYILNESPAALARYAYIAHHEGLAGARRFLRGDVDISERQFLQNIQRPADRARYLAANGNDMNRAYRDFHANLIDGRVDVTQYMANRDGVEVPPTRTLFR